MKSCPCGSGLPQFEINDARGIFLTFACNQCRSARLKQFHPDVLTDPNYWHDEPIDDD